MKTNPLFLSSPMVESNLRLVYNVFYDLKASTVIDSEFDELLLLLLFPKTVKQLAAEMQISRQALHQRLKKIKSRDWLEKKIITTDGRQYAYCLNTAGQAVVEDAMTAAVKKLSVVYQQAGSEAVAGFVKVVELLYNQSGKKYG